MLLLLTFGRNVHPARERRLFDMVTISSLSKQVLEECHVERKKLNEGGRIALRGRLLISEVARLKLSRSLAVVTGVEVR